MKTSKSKSGFFFSINERKKELRSIFLNEERNTISRLYQTIGRVDYDLIKPLDQKRIESIKKSLISIENKLDAIYKSINK